MYDVRVRRRAAVQQQCNRNARAQATLLLLIAAVRRAYMKHTNEMAGSSSTDLKRYAHVSKRFNAYHRKDRALSLLLNTWSPGGTEYQYAIGRTKEGLHAALPPLQFYVLSLTSPTC